MAIMTPNEFMEKSQSLQPGRVFRTFDTKGDLFDKEIYVKSVDGDEVVLLLPNDKTEHYTTISSLKIDKKSIRKYDSKIDKKKFGNVSLHKAR